MQNHRFCKIASQFSKKWPMLLTSARGANKSYRLTPTRVRVKRPMAMRLRRRQLRLARSAPWLYVTRPLGTFLRSAQGVAWALNGAKRQNLTRFQTNFSQHRFFKKSALREFGVNGYEFIYKEKKREKKKNKAEGPKNAGAKIIDCQVVNLNCRIWQFRLTTWQSIIVKCV